jgi:hypothetical protein
MMLSKSPNGLLFIATKGTKRTDPLSPLPTLVLLPLSLLLRLRRPKLLNKTPSSPSNNRIWRKRLRTCLKLVRPAFLTRNILNSDSPNTMMCATLATQRLLRLVNFKLNSIS